MNDNENHRAQHMGYQGHWKIIIKNGKYLEKLTKINKTQINKIRDEKGTTTDTKHIQKIMETVPN